MHLYDLSPSRIFDKLGELPFWFISKLVGYLKFIIHASLLRKKKNSDGFELRKRLLFDDRYRVRGTLSFACTTYNASIKIYNFGFFLATAFLNLEDRHRAYVNTGAIAITFFGVNLYLNHSNHLRLELKIVETNSMLGVKKLAFNQLIYEYLISANFFTKCNDDFVNCCACAINSFLIFAPKTFKCLL